MPVSIRELEQTIHDSSIRYSVIAEHIGTLEAQIASLRREQERLTDLSSGASDMISALVRDMRVSMAAKSPTSMQAEQPMDERA